MWDWVLNSNPIAGMIVGDLAPAGDRREVNPPIEVESASA